jgi:membrane fusion protein, adhesin transport system
MHGTFSKPGTFRQRLQRLRAMPRRGGLDPASMVVYGVAGLLLFLVVWAALAEVDEVTRGEGKVISSRKTQTIQSSEPGVVQEIMVRLGQQVKEGDVLVRLDNTMTSSNLGEVEAKVTSLRAQEARLHIERDGAADEGYKCPDDIQAKAPAVCANEANLLATRAEALHKRLQSLAERVEQRQRELNEAEQNATRINEGLELAQRELDLITPLAAKNIAPKTELLRAQRAVVELRGQQAANTQARGRVAAALREAQGTAQEASLQFKQDALAELSKVGSELAVIRETAKGAEERVRRTDIRSPVTGIINALAVNTVGGFVSAGGHIMDIVPLDDTLLIEAKVKPSDIAFIRAGQPALVKITAYDFSIYGGLDGVVDYVPSDSVYDEQARETFYTVIVRTQHASLNYGGRENPIMPGMISQVEILTGKKTILGYLLKPVLKARHEALSER